MFQKFRVRARPLEYIIVRRDTLPGKYLVSQEVGAWRLQRNGPAIMQLLLLQLFF